LFYAINVCKGREPPNGVWSGLSEERAEAGVILFAGTRVPKTKYVIAV